MIKLIEYIFIFINNNLNRLYNLKILREELQASRNQIDRLQTDYSQVKLACLELEQQQKTVEQMKNEYKNLQTTIYEYENKQFNDK